MRGAHAALAVAVLAALLALAVTSASAQELKPISPFAATEVAPPSAFAQRPVAAPFQSRGPLGGVFAWVLDKQQSLQRTLAMSVKGLKTDNPMAGALTLAGLSFLYGILHAVGPGHGKTIISSYVVANEETVRRGVIISFIAAGLQALTAVALVALLLFGLNATGLQVNAWSNQLESLSYAMIALVGLYLLITQLYRLWRNWRSGPVAHAAGAQAAHGHGEHHQHDHAHHDHITTTTMPTTITTTTMTTITTAIITRRERRATTSSMRGSLPGRSRGGRSWRWCSRSASGPAPGRSSCSSSR